jgi:capsular exopolysaccharide synthesis family protein
MGLFGRNRKHQDEVWNVRTMFGPYLNFAATEAYKLLRTNIVFSFPDDGKGRVVGITSAVQNEGKSTTAANTAYALAEAGYRVLLLEGDLRKPTVSSKLGVERTPGLTNLLVARGDYRNMIQHCSSAPKFDIISSGDIPPNPSELLGSERMAQVMEELKADYDYIIVDLPPVTVVSDAVAVSKILDGVIVVVRGGVSDQQMLAEALRQLEMVNVRIIGFAYRDTDNPGTGYYRYKNSKKYSKYYNKYYADYTKKKR